MSSEEPLIYKEQHIFHQRLLNAKAHVARSVAEEFSTTTSQNLTRKEYVAVFLKLSMYGKMWNYLITFLSVLSSILYVVETYVAVEEADHIFVLDRVMVVFFILDFILNLCVSDHLQFLVKFSNLSDAICSIVLVISWALYSAGRYSGKPIHVNFFRIIRVFRLVKQLQTAEAVDAVALKKTHLALLLGVLIFCTGSLFLLVEQLSPVWYCDGEVPGQAMQFHDSLYYIIVTFSTVGYGDISSCSLPGRVVTALAIIIGIALVPSEIAELTELITNTSPFRGAARNVTNHVILCGEVPFVVMVDFLREFFHTDHARGANDEKVKLVVLVPEDPSAESRKLLREPFFRQMVTFLNGSSLIASDLKRARVEHASAACVLAPSNLNEASAALLDHGTVLRCLALRNSNPSVRIFSILMNAKTQRHLVGAGVDTLIFGQLRAHILAQTALSPGFSTLFTLLTHSSKPSSGSLSPELAAFQESYANELYSAACPNIFHGVLFHDAARQCYHSLGVTLVAVLHKFSSAHLDAGAILLAPTQYRLKSGQRLFGIAHNSAQMVAVENMTQPRASSSSVAAMSDIAEKLGSSRRKKKSTRPGGSGALFSVTGTDLHELGTSVKKLGKSAKKKISSSLGSGGRGRDDVSTDADSALTSAVDDPLAPALNSPEAPLYWSRRIKLPLWLATKLRDAFVAVDQDKTGVLQRNEFELLLRQKLNVPISRDDVHTLFEIVDRNSDGSVDFSEFAQMMKDIESARDSDGLVDFERVQHALKARQQNVAAREAIETVVATSGMESAQVQGGDISDVISNRELRAVDAALNAGGTGQTNIGTSLKVPLLSVPDTSSLGGETADLVAASPTTDATSLFLLGQLTDSVKGTKEYASLVQERINTITRFATYFLSNHIIITGGIENNLQMMFHVLRSPAMDSPPPIVLLSPEPPTENPPLSHTRIAPSACSNIIRFKELTYDRFWNRDENLIDVFYVRGSPLDGVDLRRCNVSKASRVIVLRDTTLDGPEFAVCEVAQPALQQVAEACTQSYTIFEVARVHSCPLFATGGRLILSLAIQGIQRDSGKNCFAMAELMHGESVSYLNLLVSKNDNGDDATGVFSSSTRDEWTLSPAFSSGAVWSADLVCPSLAWGIFEPEILQVLHRLCGVSSSIFLLTKDHLRAPLTRSERNRANEELGAITQSYVSQIDIPAEFWSEYDAPHRFEKLVDCLIARDMIPIGLFRPSHVMVNPHSSVVVCKEDRVFVLSKVLHYTVRGTRKGLISRKKSSRKSSHQ